MKKVELIPEKKREKKCVKCHMSHVTCHQRQQPQSQTLPLLTPPLCIIHYARQPIHLKTEEKNLKPQNCPNLKKKIGFLSFAILTIRTSTRSLHSTRIRVPPEGTDKQQIKIHEHRSLWTESVKNTKFKFATKISFPPV